MLCFPTPSLGGKKLSKIQNSGRYLFVNMRRMESPKYHKRFTKKRRSQRLLAPATGAFLCLDHASAKWNRCHSKPASFTAIKLVGPPTGQCCSSAAFSALFLASPALPTNSLISFFIRISIVTSLGVGDSV